MSKRMRQALGIVAGVAVMVAAVVWLAGGFGKRIEPGRVTTAALAPPPDATQAVVERISGAAFEWASGTVAPARHTAVASRIVAHIDQVRVRAGDRVGEGEVVVVLDARDLRAKVGQAEEALRAARAELEFAKTEKTRSDQLLAKGVTTRQRYDQAVSRLRVAEADVQRLTQSLKEARAALSYTEIRAPVAGRVIDRLAEPGDTALPGQPLLRIYDPTALRVEAPVRETLAVRLRVGETLRVEVPAIDSVTEDTIEEIVPYADPGARTLLVKVRLDTNGRLVAGMFARVAVPAGERTRLLVPEAAIERIGQLEYTMVMGRDGRLERRLVTTGEYRTDGRIEVLSGLAEGERVVYSRPATSQGQPSAAQR